VIALVTATSAEMRAALGSGAKAEPPERGAARSGFFGREALLLVTGVGPVNAALELGAALERFRPSGVVNLGVAGSFDLERAPLGSTVAATAEILAEYGVTGPDGLADASAFAFPQWAGGGRKVAERLALDPDEAAGAMGLALAPGFARGPALTVAGVTGDFGRARALAARHGALAESMEGFALALGCLTRGLPFLEVRTISNRVGERDRNNWTLKQALAGLEAVAAGLFRLTAQNRDNPVKTSS
jgi:futalosine hydrolase